MKRGMALYKRETVSFPITVITAFVIFNSCFAVWQWIGGSTGTSIWNPTDFSS